MAVPPEVQEQIRRLFFQLQEVGYPDDLARMGCSIAALVTAVAALATALDQLAADHFGPQIPLELTQLIGHAKAAADASYAVALGTLDLTPRDDDPG
jgi:hypothetical protein